MAKIALPPDDLIISIASNIVEGLIVGLISMMIFGFTLAESFALGMTSSAVFYLLDVFHPPLGQVTRHSAGRAMGVSLLNGSQLSPFLLVPPLTSWASTNLGNKSQ